MTLEEAQQIGASPVARALKIRVEYLHRFYRGEIPAIRSKLLSQQILKLSKKDVEPFIKIRGRKPRLNEN